MNTTQLKAQLARMSAEMSHYDERLAHLSDIERARAQAIDERDVARQDATYWQARAERAEARVAELEAGQGWRPVDDLDLDRDIEAEIMMRATFQHEYGAWDARSINILRSDVDFWRPVPPQ